MIQNLYGPPTYFEYSVYCVVLVVLSWKYWRVNHWKGDEVGNFVTLSVSHLSGRKLLYCDPTMFLTEPRRVRFSHTVCRCLLVSFVLVTVPLEKRTESNSLVVVRSGT